MNQNSLSCKSHQVFFLTVSLLTSRLFTNQPLLFTRISGTGAPVSAALSGLAILVLIYLFTKKFYAEPNGNIISCAQKSLGSFGKYAVSLVLLAYLGVSSVYLLKEFSEFTKLLAFPTAPLWFVAAFFAVAAVCGAAGGIKCILRISRYTVPFFIAVFLMLILSVLWGCDLSNLFPVLGTGIFQTLGEGFSGISLYSDIVLLFLINPFSHSPKTSRRAIMSGALTAVIINILLVLTYTAKIPYPISVSEHFPLYLLSKEVYFGRFFQRIDAILLLASALSGMFSLSLNLMLMTKVLEQTFDISPRRVSLFPTAIAVFLFASGIFSNFDALATVLCFAALGTAAVIALLKRKEVQISDEK